jgi:hypothetical protein
MGYHPGMEDDAVYLAAIKNRLNPALYPHDAIFVRIQMHATTFDRLVAGFVYMTGIPLATAELLWQAGCIVAVLFCCHGIARQLFKQERAQWAGVALVGAMFTLPVSGTALYLVDQHLHPRALATALILFAVGRLLAGKRLQALPFLLLALILHPIMAAFGISFCAILALTMSESTHAWWSNRNRQQTGVAVTALIPLGWLFRPPSPVWSNALATRQYLLLDHWAWYEWLGALAPILLFWLLWRVAIKSGEILLARFALAVFLFAALHEFLAIVVWSIPALVRLTPYQPMRFLHLVYLFMALMAGCLIGKYLLKANFWRWTAYLLVINAGMFISQRALFRNTEHFELPGRTSANPWLQAFAWIRGNTPPDAYFALDPYYLAAPGEEFHGFRALAERSQLADAVKDTAVVGLFPALAPAWREQTEAQKNWPDFKLADFERLKSEFGVNWVVVALPPANGLVCRWHNGTVSVCQVP